MGSWREEPDKTWNVATAGEKTEFRHGKGSLEENRHRHKTLKEEPGGDQTEERQENMRLDGNRQKYDMESGSWKGPDRSKI